jgi:hypothetical protein
MWYIFIIAFVIIGFFISPLFTGRNFKENTDSRYHIVSTNFPLNLNDTIKGMFSKKQIEEKIKRLAETSPPENLSFGAMCYIKTIVQYDTREYVCPICGEKTIYGKNVNTNKFEYIDGIFWEIDACRREIEKVKGINIKLDESQFCKHCSPEIKNPELCLLVNIANLNDTTKVCNISYMEIRYIHEFLNDQLVHKGERESETPLINNIPRIKELLGLK